jgi:predicted O-methyltransferase YrrM
MMKCIEPDKGAFFDLCGLVMLPKVARPFVVGDMIGKGYQRNPYLGVKETAVLVHMVRSVEPKVMIEIGCQRGVTARNILDNVPSIESYVGIDVEPEHMPTLSGQRSEVPSKAGIEAMADPRFDLIKPPRGSADLTAADFGAKCDVVFIDGDHSTSVVLHDSMLARDLVRPGGLIIWHDYTNSTVEVTAVLDQLHKDGWPIVHIEGTWLAFMWVGEERSS